MRWIVIIVLIFKSFVCFGQDSQLDFSRINPSSQSLEHLLSLFTIHGVPKNQNALDTLSILINHGYCVGFSTQYNQPLWVAYQVSKSRRDVDYERYPFFVDDVRLKPENRIGTQTFGNGFDLGHMAPNAAINKQYSKLSQMETFLMSNICPQSANLNRGVWARLESEILNKYPNAGNRNSKKDHVWVVVGPVFSENPEYIRRSNGVSVAIPEAFFCILVRPKRYPYDSPGNSDYLAFIFPQDVESNQRLDTKFITSINEIERLTQLNFFPDLSRLMEDRIENAITLELW
ncbi:DNA/RNA non-specific endonuclease [Cecembia lonarensis]|uniref:Nuclease n=1 Tax=Cecembia lonarensis (strain CCUG 58316 / KCTC 22772 / LW9) TaxID=1225176 RepID=K1LBA7_CECL9|nr:DNA/RNA non-specific endonuclease [Cecembia lonarensis]EKB47658.1 Nuclease precursor [Cecembia lonarensis LW9]